jgi:hypothetical protein
MVLIALSGGLVQTFFSQGVGFVKIVVDTMVLIRYIFRRIDYREG